METAHRCVRRPRRDPVSATIEMFRDAGSSRGRNRFSCSLSTWELLTELGRTFGWRPTGTTYVVPVTSRAQAPALRNYEPGGSQDTKLIETQDALAWAQALELAKTSPHVPAMIEARALALARGGRPAGDLLPGIIEEFVVFAYGGAFKFAVWGDATTDAECGSQR
jgi:hypothetical protein